MSQPPPIMPPMPYASYATQPFVSPDESHVKTLSICHYVLGGLALLFSLFGLLYVGMGVLVAKMDLPTSSQTTYTTMNAAGQVSSITVPNFGNVPATAPAFPAGTTVLSTSSVNMSPPTKAISGMFIAFGSVFFLIQVGLGILNFIGGRQLGRRTGHTYSIILAAINCVYLPFGTVLGIFTFLVLLRPGVKALYAQNSKP